MKIGTLIHSYSYQITESKVNKSLTDNEENNKWNDLLTCLEQTTNHHWTEQTETLAFCWH